MELKKRTIGGSPGRRVLAAYLALVMLVAMVGPGISVYAAEGDVIDAEAPVIVPAEESVASVEVPAAEEAAAAEAPPAPMEPAAEAPEVVEAKPSVPTPEVFPAAVISASVDPVLSPDANPPLTAGGIRINSPSSGTYTASSSSVSIMAPVPADFQITLQVFEQSTGAYLSFTSNYKITKVVMKGGADGANIYTYSPATNGDSFLHCPANPNGKWAGVSHVDFYFAAVPTTGSVTAMKYEDLDRDATWDEGVEPVLSGWKMTLYDSTGAIVSSGLTDAEGKVRFTALAPGEYTVRETGQSGWNNSTPMIQNVTVSAGQASCVRFGNYRCCMTGDLTVYKYWDASDDGDYDDGELMLSGWTFTLYDSDDNVVDGDVTGADGSIAFDDLAPGEYHVTETLLGGWRNTTPLTQYVTIEAGDSDELWFGNIPQQQDPETGDLIVYKFQDDNENQVRDPGEAMLEDWHFTLTHESAPIFAQVGPLAIELVDEGDTDADGEAFFTGLEEGLIYVTETLQDGWTNTTPLKQSTTIVAGETAELWFGNVPVNDQPETGDLVIHKYEDENENQVHDPGEPMLEDWEFTVINPAGPMPVSVGPSVALIGTGKTNAEGTLSFTGLDPMTVEITETLQDGWENTTPLTQTAQIVAGETTHVWFGNVQFLQFTELDLAIEKTVDDRTVEEGQLITYTLSYWNLMSEEDAYDYTIVDDYDERYITIVNANGGTVSGGKITWTFPGPLSQAMGKQTLTYTARVNADMPDRTTTIDNVVVIDDDRDFNPDNNTDNERVVYTPDDPFLPFTGGEYLLLVLAAVAASVTGLVLRRKPRAS